VKSETQIALNKELLFARRKFPSNKHLHCALIEEVGELAQSLMDGDSGKSTPSEIFAEAIQVAAMAIRVAEEGSKEFAYQYSEQCYKDYEKLEK
jgi:hypothetical protein